MATIKAAGNQVRQAYLARGVRESNLMSGLLCVHEYSVN
jgi:hypothetical protein